MNGLLSVVQSYTKDKNSSNLNQKQKRNNSNFDHVQQSAFKKQNEQKSFTKSEAATPGNNNAVNNSNKLLGFTPSHKHLNHQQTQNLRRRTNAQIMEDQQQAIEDLMKMQEELKKVVEEVKHTYKDINDIIQHGDNEEIKLFQKDNYDIDFNSKSPKILLQHIMSLFKVFSRNKQETSSLIENSKIQINDKSGIQDYIFLLQKAEAENRQNIREKQQLKLSLEAYQEKLKTSEQQNQLLAEYSQNEMEDILKEYYKKLDDLKNNSIEIEVLNQMIRKQKKANESLEERCLSIIILENKCKKLGQKCIEDLQRQKSEYEQEKQLLNRQTRETMRKDRTMLEQKNQQLQNNIQFLNQLNKSLKSENVNRTQQLGDIIDEKEQRLCRIVEQLQVCQLNLADKNSELYLIKNMKEDYGNPSTQYPPILKKK